MRSEANVPARNRAVFLDRDGVLIEDVGLLTAAGQIRILEGAPLALRQLQRGGVSPAGGEQSNGDRARAGDGSGGGRNQRRHQPTPDRGGRAAD